MSFQVEPPSGNESHRKELVPAPGKDPNKGKCWGLGDVLGAQIPVPAARALSCPLPPPVLENSFYHFADKIHVDDWKRFGHSLGLEWNDVIMVNSKDDFYGMLYRWKSREGSKVSVNTLLDTLHKLKLSGVAEEVSSMLVESGNFQYETS